MPPPQGPAAADAREPIVDRVLDWIGTRLARRLTERRGTYETHAAPVPAALAATLRPCDVLLVEGAPSKISTAIKYLTQSTWSHAALYVGDIAGGGGGEADVLVEAELGEGIIRSPLSKYAGLNTRIMRPVGLTDDERCAVIDYALRHVGGRYDTRNVIDLMRYLLPQPPVPHRLKRRMLALGSGDPTRAICSTLIARAFETIRYPILPTVERREGDPGDPGTFMDVLHIRHHSLYAPRDFDVSPYFECVKPTIAVGFDFRQLSWADRQGNPAADGQPQRGRV